MVKCNDYPPPSPSKFVYVRARAADDVGPYRNVRDASMGQRSEENNAIIQTGLNVFLHLRRNAYELDERLVSTDAIFFLGQSRLLIDGCYARILSPRNV